MKKIVLILAIGIAFIKSDTINIDSLKDYKYINIEINISHKSMSEIKRLNKNFGFILLQNPKFRCKDLGFKKIVAKSTIDNIYRVNYEKGNRSCVEETYLKGSKEYGNEIWAIMKRR